MLENAEWKQDHIKKSDFTVGRSSRNENAENPEVGKKVTGLSQARWNQAQSKRKAALFLYANFGEKDYYATFTYSDQFLPEKPADAKRDQENTLKKLKRLYEKEGSNSSTCGLPRINTMRK